jgi:hypothetical protein
MTKRKAKAPETPKASPLVTGPAAQERARRDADYAWDKAQQEAQKAYDMLMHGAWQRYITALKAHGVKPSGKTDFSTQYDREREMALKGWRDTTEKADKKLKATLDAIEGDQEPTDET